LLRKIFGFKREDITREWRRMPNEELYDLQSIQVIKPRKIRWAGHVARNGDRRGAYRVMVGRSQGKILLGRSKRRWDDNINKDL
jgi:hypothetical protein